MLLARNKQGALELSIGTIVVIVIGMSMLILGLVLVKTIFTGSTAAIGQLNDKVQGPRFDNQWKKLDVLETGWVEIERMAMLKYGINDLRMFYENDIRFLKF